MELQELLSIKHNLENHRKLEDERIAMSNLTMKFFAEKVYNTEKKRNSLPFIHQMSNEQANLWVHQGRRSAFVDLILGVEHDIKNFNDGD